MRDQILKLLGNGLSPTLVATTVGCTPAYISQLMQEDEFALEVAKRRCANFEQAADRDAKYDKLEDALLSKLEDILHLMMKPRDILDALTRINAAKRRGTVAVPNADDVKTTIINLHLPSIALQAFQLNGQSEVVQVGERELVNMPAGALMKSLEERSAKDASLPSPREKTQLPKLDFKQTERAVITPDSV